MLRHLLIFLFFNFSFSFLLSAQTDTNHLRISLLTCSPGEELYSTFGHSAIRITDSVLKTDSVYNYGTFNFEEPGFYKKFILGKLTFYLSAEDFDSFLYAYQQENRGVIEQVLHLTSTEKNNTLSLLHKNMMKQNMFYKYDFTFDNCTTRLRDLIEKAATSPVGYGKILQTPSTFRNLIYEYLDYNDNQWSKLGIDLLLGSKLDAIMTNRQVMFLPDYLMKTLDSTKIGNTPVVLSTQTLYTASFKNNSKNYSTHPAFIFSILFLLIALLSFSKKYSVQKFISNFDGLLFFITGLLGILMLFMWFGTDHLMCKNNYNLLWAWPAHAIAAFYINKGNKQKFVIKTYFKLSALINALLLISWFFLPQHLNISVLPIIILLLFRSIIIGYKPKQMIL